MLQKVFAVPLFFVTINDGKSAPNGKPRSGTFAAGAVSSQEDRIKQYGDSNAPSPGYCRIFCVLYKAALINIVTFDKFANEGCLGIQIIFNNIIVPIAAQTLPKAIMPSRRAAELYTTGVASSMTQAAGGTIPPIHVHFYQ